MSAPILASQRSNIENLVALAGLLERVEHSVSPLGAEQYRTLVQRVGIALAADMPSEALQAVLGAHPAAAELYENLHYDHAGLVRAPLEKAVAAEAQARELLARLTRRSKG